MEREGRTEGTKGLVSERGFGRNGNDGGTAHFGKGRESIGRSICRKIAAVCRLRSRVVFDEPESPRTAIHPFTRFSHEYSIEADKQTDSPFRIRSPKYSISEHKYPRFVVAANQGLIRLLSLLSSRPLERKMTEKVRFSSPFSPRICHF